MKTGAIYLLYILAVFSMLCGCRTPRNTEAAVQRDYSGDLLGLSRQMDSLRASFELSRRRITDKLSNLKLEHTTTYYTLPDSMGRQYPVYVSTTKADKDERTSEKAYTDLMATIRRMEAVVDSLSRRVDAALREEQKVAELSWWDRHKGYLYGTAAGVVLAIIAYIIFKSRRK